MTEEGRLLRQWPQTGLRADGDPPTPPVSDPYQHHVPRWISHEHDSYAAALAGAMSMGDRSVLVVRLLESKDWH